MSLCWSDANLYCCKLYRQGTDAITNTMQSDGVLYWQMGCWYMCWYPFHCQCIPGQLWGTPSHIQWLCRLLQEEWLPWPGVNTFGAHAQSWTVSTNVLIPQILLIHILASTWVLTLFRKMSNIRWLQVPFLPLLLSTMITMTALMMSGTACLSLADLLYQLFIPVTLHMNYDTFIPSRAVQVQLY